MTSYTKTCSVCNTTFQSQSAKASLCSIKCTQDRSNASTAAKRKREFMEKYGDDPLMPTCSICGWKAHTLVSHLRYHHKLTSQQYKDQQNKTDADIFHPDLLKQKSARISGKNNPGFQHGGTMSSYSTKFEKYADLSEAEVSERIETQYGKLVSTRAKNYNDNTTLEYYISRGATHEEAVELRADRQRTFSKELCIEKYGQEEGLARWLDRQERWQDSPGMSSLKLGVSKVSQELFSAVSAQVKLNHYYASNGLPDTNNEYKLRTQAGVVKLDFFVPGTGHIIEFDGDYWHSDKNPRNIATEVRDAKILTSFPHFKILHIWEGDYRNDKQGTIQKCLDFLAT